MYIVQKCSYCKNRLRGTEVEYFKEVPVGAKDKGVTETCIQVTCPYCDKDYGYYEGSMYTHKPLSWVFRRRIVYTAIIDGNAADRQAYYISGKHTNAESHGPKLTNIKVASIGNVGSVKVGSWEKVYY